MNRFDVNAGAYSARLERVVKWLAEHLDETLDLPRLAAVAGMSAYHFHRVYHAACGETVAETVRRLRLHRAAVDLIASDLSIQRVARRAGYASQTAFTRAFKIAYGVPPARYRTVNDSRLTTDDTEDAMETTTSQQATIRTIPVSIRLAALPHQGDYMNIGHTFEQLAVITQRSNLWRPKARSFAIYYDDPSASPSESLRADACITAPPDWKPTYPLVQRDIRAGRYAVTLHLGPYAELERTYSWLYGKWLIHSGEEPGDAPCVEEYLNDPRIVPATELLTEIWLPLL